MDFSKTIAACDLKRIVLMRIFEYFLTLAKGHLHIKIKVAFQSTLGHFQPNCECKLVDTRK